MTQWTRIQSPKKKKKSSVTLDLLPFSGYLAG